MDPQLYDEVLGCYRKTGAFEKVRGRKGRDVVRGLRLWGWGEWFGGGTSNVKRGGLSTHTKHHPPTVYSPPSPTQRPTNQAMDLCDEMRALRLNPTKEGYAFIATVAVRDGKTYLVARTLETMQQEGFSAEVSLRPAGRQAVCGSLCCIVLCCVWRKWGGGGEDGPMCLPRVCPAARPFAFSCPPLRSQPRTKKLTPTPSNQQHDLNENRTWRTCGR